MILLGADLVGIFRQSKITLPTGIFQIFKKIEHKTFTPIIIGIGTFFLPCGFTQSMQIAALSSNSFLTGGLIML
jgi:sulfite exporter TauE/SafE